MVSLNLNEDTEFRDALIAQGIIEAPVTTPPSPERALPSDADLLAATLSLADEATLRTLADETQDDDEHALFLSYRARRLAELQATERKARFGALVPISRADWAKEVTEGSRVPEPGTEEDRVRTEAGDADEVDGGKKGTGVVVCLYKDGQPASEHLKRALASLAPSFPQTKFVSIPGRSAIENYPDQHQPTLIVYRMGNVMGQVVGGEGVLGKGSPRDIQTLLLSLHAILPHHLPQASALQSAAAPSRVDSDDDGDDTDDDRHVGGGGRRGIRSGTTTTTAGRKTRLESDDDDDEFDL